MGKGKRTRREVILDEATRLFAERGYEGASMADLAVRVGLKKASLFHHFTSKDDLRAAVCARIVADVGAAIARVLGAQGTYEERLESLSDAIVRALAEHPHAARVLLREAMDGPTSSPPVQAILAGLSAAEAFVAGGQKAGVFRAGDPRQMVITFASAHVAPFCVGGVIEKFAGHGPFEARFLDARMKAVRAQTRVVLLADA